MRICDRSDCLSASFVSETADGGWGQEIAARRTDFGSLIAEETEKWGKVVRFAGIRAE